MEFDSFLSYPKWEILQIIARRPSSPLELSKELKTTVAYMSQQLKLLDAAGLFTKKKTGASEKGQPRSVYSISREKIYFASLTANFADKLVFDSTPYHQTTLNIWRVQDTALHLSFSKIYCLLDSHKSEVDGIFLDLSQFSGKLIVVSESKKIKQLVEDLVFGLDKKPAYIFVAKNNFRKIFSEKFVPLYDPFYLGQDMKGGTTKDNNGK